LCKCYAFPEWRNLFTLQVGGYFFRKEGRTLYSGGAYIPLLFAWLGFLSEPNGVLWVWHGLMFWVLMCSSATQRGHVRGAWNLGFKALIKNVAGPLNCAASMGLLLWISDRWIFGSQASVIRLVIQVPLGVLVYGFLIRQFRLEAFSDVKNIIIEMGGQRKRFLRWLIGDK
jgi:hypothetical protein